ncbi:MAG TPA: hypothetical protein VJ884_03570, partial [Salinibacter sp.]|nr:hypothetical protein [Salinibacter sp.]
MSSYTLPSGEDAFTGACAFDHGLCAWAGAAAYRWAPEDGWTALSSAPAAIDSGYTLQSGVVAGADTHIGFLPSEGTDWAGWVDLSTFSDAHPMYGDLLLCIHASTETYTLFSVSSSGLEPLSTFEADELADPVAGWCAPTNPERVLLLGEGGLWSLNPPYTASDRQHLVSFDDVELPAFEDIPGPFQPGPATVVVPRRSRTGLRLDLSDGSGHATGLNHLPGGAALWMAYLQDDAATADRLLRVLAGLPEPPRGETLRLHDVLMRNGMIEALVTSAGLYVPSDDRSGMEASAQELITSPLDTPTLTTWGLWLGWDGTLESACRQLCTASESAAVLVESLRAFAGADAVRTLFDLLRSDEPPAGPKEILAASPNAVRALVASFGDDVAELVSSSLTAASLPARVVACVAAGALQSDLGSTRRPDGENNDASLWGGACALPEKELLANAQHDHPAVRAAARDTCARLS